MSLQNETNCLVKWLLVFLSIETPLIKWEKNTVPALIPSGCEPPPPSVINTFFNNLCKPKWKLSYVVQVMSVYIIF